MRQLRQPMKHKALTLGGSLTALLLLVACGGGATDTLIGTQSQTVTSEAEVTEVSITWRIGGEDDPMERLLNDYFIPQFEAENPDIRVVPAPIIASEADYFARVALMLSSPETAPDVVNQDSFQLNADASAGFLLPLDEKLAGWADFDNYITDLKQAWVAASGRTYGIPGSGDSRGLWFNRDVMAQAGLGRDFAPANWADIIAAAIAIRDHTDAIPFAFNVARSAGEGVTMQTFLMLLEGTDDGLYDGDSGRWIARSQGFLDSLRLIDVVFNQEGLAPPMSIAMAPNYSQIMMQDLFPTGQAGIVLDGFWNGIHWNEGGTAAVAHVEEHIGFAMMPTQFGQAPGGVTLAGGWGWALPYHGQNHEAAFRVIQGLGSMQMAAERSVLSGDLPVRVDSATDPRITQRPFIETATQFLENARFRPAREAYPQISVEIQIAVEAVAGGASTPEQAAEAFERAVIALVGEDNVILRDAQ